MRRSRSAIPSMLVGALVAGHQPPPAVLHAAGHRPGLRPLGSERLLELEPLEIGRLGDPQVGRHALDGEPEHPDVLAARWSSRAAAAAVQAAATVSPSAPGMR